MVELLAAIPSVVLGLGSIYYGTIYKTILKMIYEIFGFIPFFSTQPLGAGMMPAILILVVMILPIITSISKDSKSSSI